MSSKKRKIWRLVKTVGMIVILLWWGVMLFFLFKRTRKPSPVEMPDINVVESGEVISEDYYSITYRGEKIGFSSRSKRVLPSGKLMFQESSFYRLPVGGIDHEVTSQAILTVDDSLRTELISFDFSADNYETSVNAIVDSNSLKVTIETEQGVFTEEYPIDGPLYSSVIIPDLLAKNNFKPDNFELPTFDPITSKKRNYEISIIGEDKLDRFGERDVMVVRMGYGLLYSTLFIEPNGTLLMENTPEGFMSVREEKEIALKLDIREGGSKDLLEEFALPLGMGVIKRPREAVELILNIENLSSGIFNLNDFNQIWDPVEKKLYINSFGFERDTVAFPPDSTDTLETASVQCNDRRIISAAEKATRGADTDFDRLLEINEYLFKNIKKDYTVSIPSAVEVLQKMRGDCNEHSILFVAMARALDIPARVNVGVIYLDGYFYYHAWPQAFADGNWRTFDPTLGQYPADAAHVKLTSGSLDEYLALLRMGDARLKLVSVTYSDGEVFSPKTKVKERNQ